MAAAKVAEAIIWFQDHSQLKVDLAKDIDPQDTLVEVAGVQGMVKGVNTQDTGLAGAYFQFHKAGAYDKICIPFMRIIAVKILEEIVYGVKKDVAAVWEK